MSNKSKFELSKLALRDINGIWFFITETWSKTQANKYYKELFKGIDSICKNPDIGKQIEHVKPIHRILRIKAHLIIYKNKNGKIFIDRILHERMDIENIIS